MATIRHFEDLYCWKLARELAKEIYDETMQGTFASDFRLKKPINDSRGSIMDNLAEGFERGGNREFIQFLSFAKGSSAEVRSQLYRALDRKHIGEPRFKFLRNKAVEVSKTIQGLSSYLRNSNKKGVKFRKKEP